MNKVSSTGLNFISRNVKENIDQTKSLQKEIVNTQQEVLNESSIAGKSFINNVSDKLENKDQLIKRMETNTSNNSLALADLINEKSS